MVVEALALRHVARSLQLVDVFGLQATGTCVRAMCSDEILWAQLITNEFQGFSLSPDLRKRAGWPVLAPLFQELQRARAFVAGSICIPLAQPKQVQRLANLVRAASRSRQAAGPGNVLVGAIRFPDGPLRVMFADQPQVLDTPQGVSTICVGDALPLNPSDGLTLHFGWQSGHLYLAVGHGSLPPTAVDASSDPAPLGDQDGLETVTVDVAVCSPVFTLNHRNVEIVVNGPWKICNTGFFVMTEGERATIEAFSVGVPCVVCAHRGRVSDRRQFGIARILHLDVVRWREAGQ